MRKRKLILLLFMPIFLIALIIPIINSIEINYWPSIINKTNGNSLYSSAIPNLAWDANGTIVSMSNRSQNFAEMCSDGAGGVIITWKEVDLTTSDDIYAQRFDSNGIPQWTNNGSLICNANQTQISQKICTDGEGGAIITWIDFRNGTENDIYAQRVNHDGIVQWTTNGTVICNASNSQDYISICSDGNGGAIIAWSDFRFGSWDIYAQKIDTNGFPQWSTNGEVVCNNTFSQVQGVICSDEAGGAIMTWRDTRNGDDDLYAQRINRSGSIQWTTNGVPICTANNSEIDPIICSDGEGGAIITWRDQRDGSLNANIYSQRINSTGHNLWDPDGRPICSNIGYQVFPQICRDGVDGWIITWVDSRSSNADIYAQRINLEGNTLWTNNGIAICTANYDQYNIKICTDGNGAIITWNDKRNYASSFIDIYAQKISSDGNVKWTTNGIAISTINYTQQYPVIASDEKGGAFIAWDDYRGAQCAIYAQFIKNELPISNNLGTIITTTSGSDTINWILSDDFGSGPYQVWANDSNGNSYLWVEASSWFNNTDLNVPINRSMAGTYQYTIEYFDDQNQPGKPTSVIVKIIDDSSVPTPNQPTENINLFLPQIGAELSNLALPLFIGILIAFLATIIVMLLLSRRIKDISGSKIVSKK